jgi:hypothetical protein
MLLACLFSPTARTALSPFGAALPASLPFGFGADPQATPVASASFERLPAWAFRSVPPLWGVTPSGSQDPERLPSGKLTLTVRPIFLRSPLPLLVSCSLGSSFRIRYVPPGSLFHEPLGTTCRMPDFRVTVKLKTDEHGVFSSPFSARIFSRMETST